MEKQNLEDQVIEKIKEVHDPEIPVNIYELGLIYKVTINDEYDVHVLMTLTSPNCPAAEIIPQEVHDSVACLEWVKTVTVEITFTPPYDPSMMSDSAKLELGID